MPTPSPRAEEKVYSTFTVGLSQFFNLSSLVRRWSNCWIRSWRTERTALGESQDCSLVARGWSRILFLVLLLYDCREASKIDWKLDADEDEDADEEAMKETGMMSRMMSGHAVLSPVRERTTSQ